MPGISQTCEDEMKWRRKRSRRWCKERKRRWRGMKRKRRKTRGND
jgi:hypothetical protein